MQQNSLLLKHTLANIMYEVYSEPCFHAVFPHLEDDDYSETQWKLWRQMKVHVETFLSLKHCENKASCLYLVMSAPSQGFDN